MRRIVITLLWTAVLLGVPVAAGAADIGSMRVQVVGGQRYFSLRDLASFYGMAMRVPPGKKIYISSKSTTLELEVDSRQAALDGVTFWLHLPVLRNRSKWLIAEADVRNTVDPLLRSSAHLRSKGSVVVVLDPGHGGGDRGANGRRNVEEKRVVLDIAKRARVHLANAGLKVYLTRETDRFVPLEERPAKVAKWDADIYVSIHLNSALTKSARGVETYAMPVSGLPPTSRAGISGSDRQIHRGNSHDAANSVLGFYLQRALVKKLKSQDRGLRRARFLVLKNAPCPAALVECGFLSNAEEEGRMLDKNYREAIALAITQGILDYTKAVKGARLAK